MEMAGIKKEIDKLGRLQIPKELRGRYRLVKEVELLATDGGLLIRDPKYKLTKITVNEKDANGSARASLIFGASQKSKP